MRRVFVGPAAAPASGAPSTTTTSPTMLRRCSSTILAGGRSYVRQLKQPNGASMLHARRLLGARAQSSDGADMDSSDVYTADWGQPDKMRKMKVALHVGYDGSSFRGLQINRENADGETVEHFLEDALYKAGGIRPSNMGDVTKIGWSRASRTDKGVHSLASVVALKMQCPDDGAPFLEDPEGLGLAADINKYLPETIQVHCVQRVVKSFRARQTAADRRYEYFMPAHVIGITEQDHEEDSRRLELFRQTLASFEGTHAFHNHTSASLYTKAKNDSRHAKHNVWRRQDQDRRAARAEKQAAENKQQGDEDGASSADQGAAAATNVGDGGAAEDSSGSAASVDGSSSISGSSSLDSASYDDGSVDSEAVGQQGPQVWDLSVNFSWSEEAEKAIASSHYRHMRSLAASDPMRLTPGGELCIKVSLWGDSFMLHQIRKMVGTAATVANGSFPLELAKASLAPPGRVNLPMMLAETLVLTEINFFPFPEGYSGQKSPVVSLTGEALRMREGAVAMRESFREKVLNSTLDQQLRAESWRTWADRVRSLKVNTEELEDFLDKYREWDVELKRRQEEKAMRRQKQEEEQAEQQAVSSAQGGGEQ